MNGQFILPAEDLVIQLAGKGVILAVILIPNFAVADDQVENELIEFVGNGRIIHLGRLNLLLHIFFFIGEVFILLPVALNVGLHLQQVQRFFQPTLEGGQIGIKVGQHQHGEVAQRGLKLFDIFHQQQCLQNLDGKAVFQIVLSQDDGPLNVGFQRRPYAFKHQVKGSQLAQGSPGNLLGHFLEHTQHGALPHRAVFAFKGVVQRQVLDGGLKQGELVGNKGIAVNKMIPVPVVAVGLRPVGEVEQRFEIVFLLGINGRKLGNTRLVFKQQPLLDDLGHIGAGELHPVLEARLDFGKVIALLPAHFTHNRVHIFLGGDDDPGTAVTLGRQAFGHRLQIGHQLDVVGNVLAHFIHKEVQAKVRFLPVDVLIDLLGKIFDGQLVLLPVFIQDAGGFCGGYASRLGIRLGDIGSL